MRMSLSLCSSKSPYYQVADGNGAKHDSDGGELRHFVPLLILRGSCRLGCVHPLYHPLLSMKLVHRTRIVTAPLELQKVLPGVFLHHQAHLQTSLDTTRLTQICA